MLHLMKLSVGSNDVASLITRQAEILQKRIERGEKAELYHRTRLMPKKKHQLLDGGSIYWVIKAKICVRQKLVDLRPVIYDGLCYCLIVFEPKPILTEILPQRPFRGWRYFEDKNAPKDIIQKECGEDFEQNYLPEEIVSSIF